MPRSGATSDLTAECASGKAAPRRQPGGCTLPAYADAAGAFFDTDSAANGRGPEDAFAGSRREWAGRAGSEKFVRLQNAAWFPFREDAPSRDGCRMRSVCLWLIFLIGLVAVIAGGWFWIADQRFRCDLDQAEKHMAGGRYSLARQRFLGLRTRRPQSCEVAYQLGLCEEKLGHLEAALTVWASIPADSPLFIKASVGRALTLMNLGRYSLAEQLLRSIPRDERRLRGTCASTD